MTTNPRCRDTLWLGQANCKVCTLRKGALFADLPDVVLDRLLMPVDQIVFGAKAVLYQEGELAHHVFSIREGLVKLVQVAANGSARIVRFLSAGDAAGLEALSDGRYRHTAESVVATDVCRIPAESLVEINRQHSALFGELMLRWQGSLDRADEVITQLSTGTAQGRVARFLLNTLSDPEGSSCIALTREDLASLLSLTVETVSRTVAEFKRRGVLEERRGQFYFDRPGLAHAATL